MRKRREKPPSAPVKRRPWCPTCGYTRYVPGPPVVRNDITYTSALPCPDCKEKPPVKLEPGQLPLDAQQRAAGEKRD
jgi:hypothetical protein